MTNEIKGGGSTNELSENIDVITAEINAYQRVAGEAIFEIGRRLKHVKENDLVHGEWAKWCKEEIGMTPQHANRFIRVHDRFSNRTPVFSLTVSVMDALATFTDEELEQEYELPNGEVKKPTDMSRREIEELKKRIKEMEEVTDKAEYAKKQAEQSVEVERKERERLEKENEELTEREPEIIEKEVVKTEYIDNTPDDYETIKREKEELAKRLADIPETKELRDRSFDTPHGVKLLDDFYNAMDDLSEWQRKYAWITSDIEQLRTLSQVDEDMQEEFRKNMNMWRTLSEIFYGRDDDIVDAEIININ